MPSVSGHDYLSSLYAALKEFLIDVSVDGALFEDSFLRAEHERFDFLHIHWPEHLWGAGSSAGTVRRARGILGLWHFLRAARDLRKPIVWTVHNLQPHTGPTLVDALGYRLVANLSDLILCHDRDSHDRVSRMLVRKDITVMHSRLGNFELTWPRPLDPSGCRKEIGVTPGERLLLCFGVIRPYKGFDMAIDAMKHLGDSYQLLIAGPAPDEVHLAALLEMAKGVDRVRIIARELPPQELVDILHAADCVLLPYREITGSAALLGALTAGRAVVAADLPFFRETLSGEPDAGVLCRLETDQDLARAIEGFFAVPLSQRSAAAQRVSERYAWPAIVEPIARWMWANAPLHGPIGPPAHSLRYP